ncbi:MULTISPECIES: Panacea domain-containing protein [unclassified Actinomyces]|uniref:Panacea domain-containing protein n=1 Tax=unclassified Actinomyces TaxID=2609248 RepID=UPI0013A6D2BE|nr:MULTISPECIES: Panacea domain-containing protein [unclassified Actinomyces]MBW3070014.1 SocA family protein [Actinomyces sp. 594]NDR54336.1 SocA family protein [Actinomyces sp. 565]
MTKSIVRPTRSYPPASPVLLAVCKYIRSQDSGADRMKLQKLLYLIQGSYLAQTGNPLFPETPQAWQYGPVYPAVYFVDRYETSDIDCADTSVLTEAQKHLIGAIVTNNHENRPVDLMKLTHESDPWVEARGDLAPEESSRTEITHESMLRFFSKPGNATTTATVTDEARWDDLPAGFMEAEEKRWAGLLERLAS